MELKDLVSSLNTYLNIAHIRELAINGLQVKAHSTVEHIALAVSARQMLFSIGLNCLRLGKTQLFNPSSSYFDQLLDVLTRR
jgi:hypothetical protein